MASTLDPWHCAEMGSLVFPRFCHVVEHRTISCVIIDCGSSIQSVFGDVGICNSFLGSFRVIAVQLAELHTRIYHYPDLVTLSFADLITKFEKLWLP